MGQQWLCELFKHEYCDECGGDVEHHTEVSVLGNPFARCDFPPSDDGTHHPKVEAFRVSG